MYKNVLKRIIDVTLALILLPFIFIVIMVVGPMIYKEDKGSIFYNANRLGKDGRVFKMYKLRSMKLNSEDIRNSDGSTYNSDNDPRVLKIGHIIRKASIDELPQVFNILKGDMSFVGPRPDLPDALKIYTETEYKKTKVRPGVTGFNQAYFRNSISQKERFSNDVYYVENISFLFDLKIVLVTIKNVLLSKNINMNKK